jgi:hypothetical protein
MNSELVSDYIAVSNRNELNFFTKLIEQVCNYLGQGERSNETATYFVNSQLLKKIKTSTQVKDKNKPKGARSGYLFFQEKVRADILQKNPDIKSTEIMVEAGKLWKELSEEAKIPYYELAKKDKERHCEEVEKYKIKATSGIGFTNAPSGDSSTILSSSSPKKVKRTRESSSESVDGKAVADVGPSTA